MNNSYFNKNTYIKIKHVAQLLISYSKKLDVGI